MGEDAKRDNNGITTLMGVSSADGVTLVRIWVDPITHRVLVDSAGAITGTGTINEIAYFDSATTIASLATITYPSLTELSYIKGLSSAIQTQLNGKQASLGFTAENVANKSTNITTDGASDTKYPSVKAVKDYADGLVTGLLDYRGAYDASVNTFPAAGGSGTAGAVLKGDMWIVSVAGTLGGTAVQIGDSVIANVDTPGQTAGNWNVLNSNISYVPEDVANKVTSISGASTDTQYPSAKLTYDQLTLKLNLAGGTMTGDLLGAVSHGATATRITKLWATDIESTNEPTVGGVQTKLLKAGGVMTGKVTLAGSDTVGATYAPATGAQTVALDVTSNNMHVVSGHASGTAITFTVTGATNNQPFIVSILQGGTTVSTITAWFNTCRWAGGTVPTLTATLNKRDTFGFIRTGANTYDAFIIGQNC